MTDHLNEIISHFAKLQQLDTDQIIPTLYANDVQNILRDDEKKPSLPVYDAISNAPEEHDNYFIVPQVVDV